MKNGSIMHFSFYATEVQHWRQDKTRQNIDYKLQLIYHTMSVHDIILNARLLNNNIIRETRQMDLKEQYNKYKLLQLLLYTLYTSNYQQNLASYAMTSAMMILYEHTMINRVDNYHIQVIVTIRYIDSSGYNMKIKSQIWEHRNSVSFGLVDNQHGQNFNT